MSNNIFHTLGVMLFLIALYPLLYYSGGTKTLFDAINGTLVNETKALQGRG